MLKYFTKYILLIFPMMSHSQELKCQKFETCHPILEANQFNWMGEKLKQEFNRLCHISKAKCQMITVRADVAETLTQLKKDYPKAYFYQNQIDQEDFIYKLELPEKNSRKKSKR